MTYLTMKNLNLTIAVLTGLTLAFGAVASSGDDDGFVLVEQGAYKAPPAKAPPRLLRQWKVPANMPVRQVLEAWAKPEGWQVYWPRADETTELVTEVEVSFSAFDFEEAVTKFANGLPPEERVAVTFNRSNSPKLLHVSGSTRRQTVINDGSAENR
ncbi:hypothetical protein [Stenotrophomonas sp. STK17_22]|uniref:hypothetical protein n=1 Tax=Stenotrophomonas sp. STK17_22 TaxID=3455201 RepID=UPI003F813E2B